MSERLVLGTRGSQLALWQANWVKTQLEQIIPDLRVEITVISTTGDRIMNVSLPKLGEQGKGLFTRELEESMLQRKTDLAVHSLKDLPTEITPGLSLAAICEREDVRDALVTRAHGRTFNELPAGAVIGTSSLRRQAQIKALRSDAVVQPVRGNVDTRLRKLDRGEFDALVLAAAGLVRLGRIDRITEFFEVETMLPAPGQGALAIETRGDDGRVNRLVRQLDHSPTRAACNAERSFLKHLGGGCLVPIAAIGHVADDELALTGLVSNPDGSVVIRGRSNGAAADAESIGKTLAARFLEEGAAKLLSG